MPTLRRHSIIQVASAVAVVGLLSAAQSAAAQSYPSRPIKIVSPYAAGGATDTISRLVGQWISEKLGGSVVVENKPGGGSNIGTEFVVRSPPDGYTILLASSINAINATLFTNLRFDINKDIAPIGNVGTAFNLLLVHPSSPAKTVADYVALLKASPDKLTIGVPGVGSPPHLSAVLLKELTGTRPIVVQYRGGGGTVMNDLIGNHLSAGFGSSIGSAEFVKAGSLRALAVTAKTQSPVFPGVPTMAETVPGYEATNFYGFAAPKGTPAAVVDTLNRVLNAGLADPGLSKKLESLGIIPTPTSPDDFGKQIASETEKWSKVIKSAGLKNE